MTPSDILTISMTIVGIVVGIIVSYGFFVISQKNKEPCWDVKSNNLIRNFGSTIPKLEILYGKEKVENLTVSRIIFWNNGAETLERNHIVLANPLRISVKQGVKILDAEVLVSNNPHSDFSLIKSNDELSARIEFEYLDKNDGAVIQIVHTGVSSIDIGINGSIKGVKIIHVKHIAKSGNSIDATLIISRIGALISIISGSVALSMSILPPSFVTVIKLFPTYNFPIILMLTIAFFTVNYLTVNYLLRKRTPKGLESFWDELLI